MRIKRVNKAYLFENGNVAAFDIGGEQIPELQGTYSIEGHQRLLLEATDNCTFDGFHILPGGFKQTVSSWFNYFGSKNMSWQELNNL